MKTKIFSQQPTNDIQRELDEEVKNSHSYRYRPASWSSGQSFWLLITRSGVRFPALPWEFSLCGGGDPRGDHGLGS